MRTRQTRISIAVACALGACVGHAPDARADEISPPPHDCAPGTAPMSSHNGEWCEDTTCATDTDCNPPGAGEPKACREVGVCVDVPGGTAPGPSMSDSPRGSSPMAGRRTYGTCTPSCRQGSCDRAKRCVPADYVEPGGGTSGGAGGGTSGSGGGSGGGGTSSNTPGAAGAQNRGCACSLGGFTPRHGIAVVLSLGAAIALVVAERRKRRRAGRR